jgi:alpha-beta hydrolase superfamily lysophospholipase
MRSLRLLAAALILLCAGCTPSLSSRAAASRISAPVPRPPSAEAVVDTGTLDGAPYRIDIPAGWNGGLVMYAHGYEIVGTPFQPEAPRHAGFRQAFTSRGFAFAQSWYRAQGWAVREGIDDTEALRRHFAARYGRPDSTFVTGNSMGGLITVATIETHGAAYDGALPLCGLLSPSLDALRGRLFDVLVTFEYLYPGVLGASPAGLADVAAPIPPRDVVTAAVRAEPARAEALARRFAIGPESVPGLVWFYAVILREMQQRAGGNPFDNRGSAYHGLGDDPAFNRGVRRYAADSAAVAWLRDRFSPTGRVADPVLAVHTTYDAVVEPEQMDRYRALAQLAGTAERFASAYVVADGHCAYTPAQVGAAFDALRTWAATGARPAEGEIGVR